MRGKRTPDAERQRKSRQRYRDGRKVVPVEVDRYALFEALVTLDLISPDTDNDEIIAAAASVAMERMIFSVTRDAATLSTSRRIKK